MAASQIRQNYHEDSEDFVNKYINLKLYASYVYLSMSYYFDRDDVALPGMKKFFKDSSDEEKKHAEKLMKFQNLRGGKIILKAIDAPVKQEWPRVLDALQAAIELEKKINQNLLDLHATATKRTDPHMTNMLENEFLDEQVEAIKKLGDMITRLKRAGIQGLGEYLFDKSYE